jgi:hypothetical protein
MVDRDERHPLEYEIRQEKAAALHRIALRMETALEAFRKADPANSDRRRDLLEEAAEAVWFYILQRESLGLRQNTKALDQFDVPGEIRARIGPRPIPRAGKK